MPSPTAALTRVGQSLWLDNITRGLLDDGTLARYIDEFHVTGLTSNPSIYNAAVKDTSFYDAALADLGRQQRTP
jgi:transaldolase